MKEHLWELHLHTAESSRCGQTNAAGMVAAYHALGFEGVVVTDHFVNGHSCAPRNAPWRERMDVLLAGYRAARKAGDTCGLRVLLGWEYYFCGADFLTYGLDEAFLYDQSDLDVLDIAEYARRVHDAGGALVQAHPFREAWYMPEDVPRRWDLVDALEVYNGSHPASCHAWNDRAQALAEAHGLPGTAGSDAHSTEMANTGVMAFPARIDSGAALVRALRAGEGKCLRGGAVR